MRVHIDVSFINNVNVNRVCTVVRIASLGACTLFILHWQREWLRLDRAQTLHIHFYPFHLHLFLFIAFDIPI